MPKTNRDIIRNALSSYARQLRERSLVYRDVNSHVTDLYADVLDSERAAVMRLIVELDADRLKP